MKPLKLVTFDGDLTQFLVEADNKLEAIKQAVEANLHLGNEGFDSYIHDLTLYTVEDVDFDLLKELIKRQDWIMSKNNSFSAVIFTD